MVSGNSKTANLSFSYLTCPFPSGKGQGKKHHTKDTTNTVHMREGEITFPFQMIF